MFAIFFLAAVSREAGASWEEIKLRTDKCLLQANTENVPQNFQDLEGINNMPHSRSEPSSSIKKYKLKT